jgi:hypothetical protein
LRIIERRGRRHAHATGETVRIAHGCLPGLENPDWLDTKKVESIMTLPDSSLAGTVKDLELWRTP